ncbi:MAG: hypothetical protein MJ058_00870 [Akkermansia sp.]|nr:hypothetical protein [Akkermansia sp.]
MIPKPIARACALAAALAFAWSAPCIAQEAADPADTTPAAEPAAPKPLSLGPESAKDKEAAKQLRKLIKEHAEQGDFDGLRDELARLLKEAFPGAIANAERPCWKAGVKGPLARQALAVQVCITLAQRSAEELDDAARQKEPDFMKWLVSDAKSPARAFVEGINKAKVADEAQAVSLMGDLRTAFAGLGKKAYAEIKGITDPAGSPVNRQLYPYTKKELDKRIKDILATKPARGVDAEQQDAVNVANVYRLLCNVVSSVTYDPGYRKDAQDAAEACKKAGTISHGLGHSTDKCNLHMNSRDIPPAPSVAGYVNDPGANNRENRGHRAWVLYPRSRKTAFGVDGVFHAMRTHDIGGTPQKTAHSYPGRGFFPKEYLKGGGWSYYPEQGKSVGSNAQVEIWRLPRSLKAAPSEKELASAVKVPVKKVYVHPDNGSIPVGNSIVFEPDYSAFLKKHDMNVGVYWVRITSGSLRDEYVVELY